MFQGDTHVNLYWIYPVEFFDIIDLVVLAALFQICVKNERCHCFSQFPQLIFSIAKYVFNSKHNNWLNKDKYPSPLMSKYFSMIIYEQNQNRLRWKPVNSSITRRLTSPPSLKPLMIVAIFEANYNRRHLWSYLWSPPLRVYEGKIHHFKITGFSHKTLLF